MNNHVTRTPKELFGSRLKELRVKAGFSQELLADLSGLDRTYISSCERGKRNISIESIYKLAHALQKNPNELLKTPTEDCCINQKASI